MNLCELSSAIFDVQPDWLSTDELISISACPDNLLVRSYFVCPQTGVSLLADYADSELDDVFSACKTLDDANKTVAHIYAEQPLTANERNYVRDFVLGATIEAALEVVSNRRLEGVTSCHSVITASVVQDLQSYFGNFQK